MGSLRCLSVVGGLMIVAGAVLVTEPAPAVDSQLLASSCSGCHTNTEKLATAIPRIRGLPETVILEAMRGFRAGQRPATVMDRIAKGYTDDEIRQLAAYFSSRR